MGYDNNINNYLMSIYIENYDNDKIFHGAGFIYYYAQQVKII